jgi:hypothetical protein
MKKKNLFLAITLLLFSSVAVAQLKVHNNGKVGICSDTVISGKVQMNISAGDNTGFCIYDDIWNTIKFKLLTSEFNSYLLSPCFDSWQNPIGIGFDNADGHIYIGAKSAMSGSLGQVTIKPNPSYNHHYALYLLHNSNTTGTSALSSNGGAVSIFSSVIANSGLTYSSSNFSVNGSGYISAAGITATSDSLLKENIRPLEKSLDKIMMLKGVSYNYKSSSLPHKQQEIKFDNPAFSDSIMDLIPDELKIREETANIIEDEIANGKHIGFLAQDVEKVLPEVVRTTPNGSKGINYLDIIALLAEGIKEQQAQIEELHTEIQELKSNISRSASDATSVQSATGMRSRLYQNAPNPFSENTLIKVFISEQVKSASLNIYDLQGKQLKKIIITGKGENSVFISASEFPAGIYLYSLITDGNEVDTKKMILTE